MEKKQLIVIAKEIHSGKIAIRQATAELSTDDFLFMTDCLSAMDRNARAEQEPERAEEHHAITALVCEQAGIEAANIEEEKEEPENLSKQIQTATAEIKCGERRLTDIQILRQKRKQHSDWDDEKIANQYGLSL